MRNNPMQKILIWLDQAKKSEINDPDAISLATVDDNGFPNVRTVLLRRVDEDSFVFFTNYGSQKAQEILNSGKVAFSFHWKSLAKQIRVRGHGEKEDGQVADNYYHSRALGSRIGAWASRQSEVLESRAKLINSMEEYKKKYNDEKKVPRPKNWSGWRLLPKEMEFWMRAENRIHERLKYSKNSVGEWDKFLLNP